MKFLFADCMDYVDPNFNFLTDAYSENREPYWDDYFAHELMPSPPYDGVLISRAMVGEPAHPGKYGESLSMRFRRVGARKHLRLDGAKHTDMPIFGDNGAFSYSHMAEPPYTVEDTVDFYGDGQFTHGCSLDHIIFEFDPTAKNMEGGSADSRKRYQLTLDLAADFFSKSKTLGKDFIPLGVIQGWSPDSLAESAKSLVKMGYRYLAIGGLVPLSSSDTHKAVAAVNDAVKAHSDAKIHLLGFAKADTLSEFTRYRHIASFDTTSPLIRAFKDATRNYYLPDGEGLKYYTAIRIPQAITNNRLKAHAKTGLFKQEDLLRLEKDALKSLRNFAAGKQLLDDSIEALLAYAEPLETTDKSTSESVKKKLMVLKEKYRITLQNRPWEQCECAICKAVGVEALIFRGSNRNKRRGFHNLGVYHQHLQRINNK